MSETIPSKRCRGCETIKPLTDFYRQRNRAIGVTARCKQCILAYQAGRRDQKRAYDAGYRDQEKNRQRIAEYKFHWRAALRTVVFGHYGTECVCCGRADDLCIDHVDGNGRAHREEMFGYQQVTTVFYRWLIDQGFPEGFQPLCRPCNTSKGDGERCRLDHVLERV